MFVFTKMENLTEKGKNKNGDLILKLPLNSNWPLFKLSRYFKMIAYSKCPLIRNDRYFKTVKNSN